MHMPRYKRPFHVVMTDAQRARLKAIAKSQKCSVGELVRRCIDVGLPMIVGRGDRKPATLGKP